MHQSLHYTLHISAHGMYFAMLLYSPLSLSLYIYIYKEAHTVHILLLLLPVPM